MGKLQPVKCGCGGKAVAIGDTDNNIYFVKCDKCWISTDLFHSKAEAITAWNLAMGANVQERAENARCNERTAKVKKSPIECFDGAYVVISGHCDCGALVFNDERNKYCSHCGARLKWE